MRVRDDQTSELPVLTFFSFPGTDSIEPSDRSPAVSVPATMLVAVSQSHATQHLYGGSTEPRSRGRRKRSKSDTSSNSIPRIGKPRNFIRSGAADEFPPRWLCSGPVLGTERDQPTGASFLDRTTRGARTGQGKGVEELRFAYRFPWNR